jgi:hypothetical protein
LDVIRYNVNHPNISCNTNLHISTKQKCIFFAIHINIG